jgi:glutathione synthase/RimK-type ligase-like ATP-grasp enzyme
MTECLSALQGLWSLLDCHWVNDPSRDEIGARKAYQLRIAREVGLETPRSLISNHPPSVRAFVEEVGMDQVIYKSFYASFDAWRETRRLRANELDLLDATRYAPVIFQEYIPATLDLRITVIGEQIFASAVHSQESRYEVDYRMDLDRVRVDPYELPLDIRNKLLRFMRRLGIVYGAIDMRVTPQGHYVFLEVNTSGQWLFMEEKTGQPITQAFCEYLQAWDRAQRPHLSRTAECLA